MEIVNVEMHTTEELVNELFRRSVAGYIAIWSYDPKSGECYSYEDSKGDPRLLRGIIEDAYEADMASHWNNDDEEEEDAL